MDATLRLARLLHLVTAISFIILGWLAQLGPFYWLACVVVVAELIFQHRLADPEQPASINAAFFNANALISVSLLAGVSLSYFLN